MSDPRSTSIPLLVGVGASAGGLDALRHFISGLPPSLPAAIVIAQHLSPTHTSLLTELLARDTRFKVVEAEDGMVLHPACIYVTPPSCDVQISDNCLRLLTPENATGAKPSINRLFSSMAGLASSTLRVGIVLSGTGSDGALGLGELRRAGGLTVVQTLASCAYDGMPRAALDSGAVDITIEPLLIGPWLARQLESPRRLTLDPNTPLSSELTGFILDAAGIDLSGYKPGTLQRRMARRMSLRGASDQCAYLELMRSDENELRAFVQDIFISVTEFFRDPPAIERLRSEISMRLLQFRGADPFRVWIPGCASGEEPYTIAILIEEALREQGRALDYRIFCTDIAQKPLDVGRIGCYDAQALERLPHDLRDRYFEPEGEGRRYRITRRVRDRLVFSIHDVTADAPFSRLDVVSCRNVLIYFTSALQTQVMQNLHYALKPGGLLFLGGAESVHAGSLGFTVIDESHRLFRREGGSMRVPLAISNRTFRRPRSTSIDDDHREPLEELASRMYRVSTERLCEIVTVVNERDELMFSTGNTEVLFKARAGRATLDLVDMTDDSASPLLRSLMFRTRRSIVDEPSNLIATRMGDEVGWLVVAGAFDRRRPGWLLLTFQRAQVIEHAKQTADLSEGSDLHTELESTRAYLQQVIEDFEATNEQLQAANEELQSANEEFHSTNEELQTTVEELRSTNEELHTVNDELVDKTRALAQSSNDLKQALLSLNDTAVIVTDEQFRLRLFNPAISRVVSATDVIEGDSLFALPWHAEIPNLRDCVQRVLHRGVMDQRTVYAPGKCFQMAVTPYRDDHEAVRGVVIIFTDVTQLARSQTQLAAQEHLLRTTLSALREGVLRIDREGRVQFANAAALAVFGVTQLHSMSLASLRVLHRDAELGLDEVLAPALMASARGEATADEVHVGLPGSDCTLAISIGGAVFDGTVLLIQEITDKVAHERQLDFLSNHDHLTGLANRRGFEQSLRAASAAEASTAPLCIAFLDLDQFKLINDVSGHQAGDEALQRVAGLLSSSLRPDDLIGRIGGDEFAILLPNSGLPVAEQVLARLVKLVSAFRISIGGHQHQVGLSCGLSLVRHGDHTGLEALAAASQAATIAKRSGGNRVELADPKSPRFLERRADQQWLIRLRDDRSATAHLVPRFEPFAILNGQHCERWELLQHYLLDDGTLAGPGEFIPIAERNHFIQHIDLQAATSALEALRGLPGNVRMHVNISMASLAHESFLGALTDRLQLHPNLAAQLSFEITETAAYQALERVRAFIECVRHFGAEVFLDDFGVGSSTLANLRLLPVHGIKIDGQLVRRILEDQADWITLESIHRIAECMDLITVAEFAESAALIDGLRNLNIHYAQGWGIGRAISLAEFRAQCGAAS